MKSRQSMLSSNPISNMWAGEPCILNIANGENSKDHPARIVGRFDERATILAGSKSIKCAWRLVEAIMLGSRTFYSN